MIPSTTDKKSNSIIRIACYFYYYHYYYYFSTMLDVKQTRYKPRSKKEFYLLLLLLLLLLLYYYYYYYYYYDYYYYYYYYFQSQTYFYLPIDFTDCCVLEGFQNTILRIMIPVHTIVTVFNNIQTVNGKLKISWGWLKQEILTSRDSEHCTCFWPWSE